MPYYIDPVLGNNANAGTSAAAPIQTPYKSGFLSSLVAGDVVYFKRGTTLYCTARIDATNSGTVGAPIVYRAYANSDGSDDPSLPNPIIHGNGQRTLFNLGTDKTYIHIYDLDFTQWGDGTGNFAFAISNATTGNDPSIVTGIQVRRCRFYNSVSGTQDVDAIHLFGADCKVMNCLFDRISDDAIWVTGDRCEIAYNSVARINTSGRNAGDCCQLGGVCNAFWVHDNFFDGSAGATKQCFIISGASAGYGGRVEFNVLIGGNDLQQCIYTDQPGTVVRGNLCINGTSAIRANAACLIEGNVHHCTYPPSFGIWLEAAGSICRGNTIYWTGSAVGGNAGTASGIYSEAGEAQTIRNNILVGCGRGIRLDEATNTENYNCFYNCTVNVKGISADPSLGANSLTVDPQIVPGSWLPGNTALHAAGTYLGGLDFNGLSFKSPPTIGAVQKQGASSGVNASPTLKDSSVASKTESPRTAIA